MKPPFHLVRRRRWRKARCLADEAEDGHPNKPPTTPQDSEALDAIKNESGVVGEQEGASVSAETRVPVEGPSLPERMPVTSVDLIAPYEAENTQNTKAPLKPSSTDIMADWIRSLQPHQKLCFFAAVFSILSFCATRNLNLLRILPIICIVEIGRHVLIWIIYITGTAEFEYVTDILIMLGGRAKTEVERTREGGFFRRRYEAVVLGGANQFGGTAWGVFSGYVQNTQERAKERRDKATEDFLMALQPLKKSN